MNIRTVSLSALALVAFAGNSVLCRLALADEAIDPVGFTVVRIVAGAITLLFLMLLKANAQNKANREPIGYINAAWLAPVMLFAYAALFSFAYVSLGTGVGALVLFGSVQITLLLMALARGERYSWFEFTGLMLACSGLVYLLFPELSKPSLSGFVMMLLAGVAWGIYTIKGQGSLQPLSDTSSNFTKAMPMVFVLLLVFLGTISSSPFGLLMAVASGAITSGLGYAIWYAVLPSLSTSQAGVMQLLVPIIAAVGGVVFAGEEISVRLVIASTLTLGGILLVIWSKGQSRSLSSKP